MLLKKNRWNRLIISIIIVVTMVATIQPTHALSQNDFKGDNSIYWVNEKTNTFYFMDYNPPRRYGKCFGRASDYTVNKNTKTIKIINFPNKSKAVKILLLVNNLRKLNIVSIFAPDPYDIITNEVKGVKIIRTTTYNKNTGTFTVGKNKKCRKEVWSVYLKEKVGKNKYSWKKLKDSIGFRSEIKLNK